MHKDDWIALAALPIIGLLGAGLAWAGSQNGMMIWDGWPLFALGMLWAFGLQWLAFIPAYLKQTELFYDLTGSLTFLSLLGWAFVLTPSLSLRALLLLGCVGLWAARLGSFLFTRILKAGEDDRFADIKPHFLRFLMAWTLQGLWVSVSIAPALASITAAEQPAMGALGWLGLAIWAFGFGVEALADHQKSQWRAKAENKGDFIDVGLWAWSRHPNYFGEITLWIGVAVMCIPVLQGWQYLTLISPVFIATLITQISGVPMLEEKADKKWGGQADYERYKANTPVLMLWPPKGP